MKLSSLLSVGGIVQRNRPANAAEVATAHQIESRAAALAWEQYQRLFTYNGVVQYSTGWSGFGADRLLGSCGPVYATLNRRALVMGDARPTFQRLVKGRPTELYSSRELELLKRPWPGGTWRQLVAICESDVAGSGNSYWTRDGAELQRLEADWVTIVTEAVTRDGIEVGQRLLGYVVQKPAAGPVAYEPGEVAHYRPGCPVSEPFRGESWLAAVAWDASSDIEMTSYKGNYLKNGGLPSLAVTYEPTLNMDDLERFVPVFAEKFTGSVNAGKVMHFLGGRDVKTLGASLDQLAFKAVQGAGETRVTSSGGVPAVVAMISEGNEGSSLNSGNYTAARRLFGDLTVRPLLGALCEAFQTIVPTPADSRLWYDDSQVSFFQEDVLDEATIREANARTLRQHIESGWDPDAALDAVVTGNLAALKGKHTGLTSVQLQPPTDGSSPPPGDAPTAQGGEGDESPN